MSKIKAASLGILAFLLSSCATRIDTYQDTTPLFDLKRFFDGDLVATGIFIDYSDKVTRRFHVDMKGSWQGDEGTLEEWFSYDDGEKTTRTWYLKNLGNNRYQGRAADINGIADGRVAGFALNWKYQLELPYRGKSIAVNFNDWMYLVDESRVINRAEVRKWGFKVGEVLLYIEKQQRQEPASLH